MGAWLTISATIILAVNGALAPVPAPSSTSSATEAKLREIGGVRVTTDICKPLLVSAGAAVDYMLDDNLKLGQDIARMRNIDLDSSMLAKSQGAQELMNRFVALRRSAVAGKAAMDKFRAEAKTVPDEKQRAALIAFANAIEGALERQRKLAEDISHLAVFVDSHPPLDEWALAQATIDLQAQSSYRYSPVGTLGYPYNIPQTLSQVSADSADLLQDRAEPMFNDEKDAATRLEPAFTGC